jgi:hypothetical protein
MHEFPSETFASLDLHRLKVFRQARGGSSVEEELVSSSRIRTSQPTSMKTSRLHPPKHRAKQIDDFDYNL